MDCFAPYQTAFEQSLKTYKLPSEPKGLYEPIAYILALGGKRLRPCLVLAACEACKNSYAEAQQAALAVELFHNFTLIHDDIMDEAPLRRGKATVHSKWNLNTGILSGDAMLILAYQQFASYNPELQADLMALFSKTALEVCEGQEYDVAFEQLTAVSESAYLKMIQFKTAVLVAAALKMGALIGASDSESAELFYDFGLALGTAFQIQDDYLDAFGDPETFGKQVGGDILENKKTFLVVKLQELGSIEQRQALDHWFGANAHASSEEKVAEVKQLFTESGAAEATREAVQAYTKESQRILGSLEKRGIKTTTLAAFSEALLLRNL
ncbi:MAG: polyprenyl synthetase family protein [Bacteroidetes bacterium]|nr:polyprenyl synthetase family protein [Bacteroidota bacterium]